MTVHTFAAYINCMPWLFCIQLNQRITGSTLKLTLSEKKCNVKVNLKVLQFILVSNKGSRTMYRSVLSMRVCESYATCAGLWRGSLAHWGESGCCGILPHMRRMQWDFRLVALRCLTCSTKREGNELKRQRNGN